MIFYKTTKTKQNNNNNKKKKENPKQNKKKNKNVQVIRLYQNVWVPGEEPIIPIDSTENLKTFLSKTSSRIFSQPSLKEWSLGDNLQNVVQAALIRCKNGPPHAANFSTMSI